MTVLTAAVSSFLPLLAFVIIMALPKEHHNAIRMFSLIASVAIFLVSLGLIGPVWSGRARQVRVRNETPAGFRRRPSIITSEWTASACGW